MSNYKIIQSSESFQKFKISKAQEKIPFDQLEISQSVPIPKDQNSLSSLRTKCSYWSKKLNRQFRVLEHSDCFEIGRIA